MACRTIISLVMVGAMAKTVKQTDADDVVVQVASDPDFTANVTTVFNNDIDNSLGLGVGKDMHYTETAEGKLIDAKGALARYVRLHSKGSTTYDANHYIEVEVYGKAAE